MGIYSNINSHRQGSGGVNWTPGKYHARIQKVVDHKGFKGRSFIIEAEVLRVVNALETEIEENGQKKILKSLQPGVKPGNVIKLDKPDTLTMALGNVADFCRAGFAALTLRDSGEIVDPASIDIEESDVEGVAGEGQPLAGLELMVEAHNIKTKIGGNFTVVRYSPIVPEARA